jgi:hypothetical protein
VFVSILDTFSDYVTPKCNAEEVKSWICYMNSLWIQKMAAYVFILAKWLVSVNPLLNALIYAGFVPRYRARVLMLLQLRGMPLPWQWRCRGRGRNDADGGRHGQDGGGGGETPTTTTATTTVITTPTRGPPPKPVHTKRVTT